MYCIKNTMFNGNTLLGKYSRNMEQSDDNFLNEDETKKKAQDIHEELKELNKELDELQENCNHTETIIKQKLGDSVKKYCKACDKYLNYPTPKELESYLYGNDRSTRKD